MKVELSLGETIQGRKQYKGGYYTRKYVDLFFFAKFRTTESRTAVSDTTNYACQRIEEIYQSEK